jgi:DNA-binding Lrp family transcriptional regulator
MIELDNVDRKLVALLRKDGRAPTSTLAKTLKLSRATVRTRIARLVSSGVIEGFTIQLGAGLQSRMIRAIMLVKIEGTKSESVVRELNTIVEIVDIFSTSGQWDSIVTLEADSIQHFDTVLRRISGIQGIRVTETSIMLTSRRTVRV